MYNFRDTKISTESSSWLPSVAMTFNGLVFEEELPGYQTLNVFGREMLSNELQFVESESSNGAIYYGQRRPPRLLVVEYKLVSDTPQEMQEKFNDLRKLLYTKGEEVEVSFRDEPGYFYRGVHSASEEIDATKIQVVSRFTIFCSNPDKKSAPVTTSGEVTIETFYPTKPDLIRVVLSTAVNNLKITNGRQTISLTGAFNAGSNITVDVEEQDLLLNGVSRPDLIDLESDFENFLVRNGDVVTTTSGSLTLQLKEVIQ